MCPGIVLNSRQTGTKKGIVPASIRDLPGRKLMAYTHLLVKETDEGAIFKSISNTRGWCSTIAPCCYASNSGELPPPLGLNRQGETVTTPETIGRATRQELWPLIRECRCSQCTTWLGVWGAIRKTP